MPPNSHALLSASSSHRWLNCPPSARLCENYEDNGSDFAAEGTDAHALCEYKLRKLLGMDCSDPTENLTWYNSEMDECATGYASFVMEVLEDAKAKCPDPTILIEQRLDYSKYVEEGFGTGDCLVIGDGTLHVIDYKHGRGVLVEAEQNPQMMLYALGALEMFGFLYDISEISMHIYQPRRANIGTYRLSKEELVNWAETTLAPKAKLAFEGKGEYACGEWCTFCKAKNDCRKRAEANLEMAKYDFKMPPLLTDDEISEILKKADELLSWINDIKDYAFEKALSGQHWDGFKLVEGRSVRKYTDEKAVVAAVVGAGYDPYEKKLLGITEMQKMLGKEKFSEVLGNLVFKPPGKPTLVPASDKRPEISTVNQDFKD